MRYYSKGYPQGLQGSPTDVTTSCISCVHASPNPQFYAFNDRSRGLKTPEHVSSLKKNSLKVGDPTEPWKVLWYHLLCSEPANETQNIDLRGKNTETTEYAKKIYPEHRIAMIVLSREKCSQASSRGQPPNRAELDYKTRHNAPRRESPSFIYESYMQYHEPIPWILLIPSI